MGKVKKEEKKKNRENSIVKNAFNDRLEFVDKESGKLLKTKAIPANVQKFKKYVKETGELGV